MYICCTYILGVQLYSSTGVHSTAWTVRVKVLYWRVRWITVFHISEKKDAKFLNISFNPPTYKLYVAYKYIDMLTIYTHIVYWIHMCLLRGFMNFTAHTHIRYTYPLMWPQSIMVASMWANDHLTFHHKVSSFFRRSRQLNWNRFELSSRQTCNLYDSRHHLIPSARYHLFFTRTHTHRQKPALVSVQPCLEGGKPHLHPLLLLLWQIFGESADIAAVVMARILY
jgi:hypothetical protein